MDPKAFADDYWETEPLFQKNYFPKLLQSEEKIFENLVHSCDDFRSKKSKFIDKSPYRIFVDENLVASHTQAHFELLPEAADHNFDQYIERCKKQTLSDSFGLVLNGYHKWDFEMWIRIRSVMGPIFEYTGLPRQGIEGVLFVGNYSKTPFGVHIDPSGVFKTVIRGEKKMSLWHQDYWNEKYPFQIGREIELFKERDSAIVHEIQSGDFSYWPSSFYHVGESGSETCISISFPMYFELPRNQPAEILRRAVEPKVKKERGTVTFSKTEPYSLSHSRSNASNCPKSWHTELDATKKIFLNDYDDLLHELRIDWIQRVSSTGFWYYPALDQSTSIKKSDVIQIDSGFPIFSFSDGKSHTIFACHGHTLRLEKSDLLDSLVETLNDGAKQEVHHLVRVFLERGLGEKTLLNLLDHFLRMRAIKRKN